ncbi:MAG TPA: HAMP domain-containing protein, partial [Spirosoma sp.]|nr:HAMP domain-containing protein [Spirosoma sp.]
MSFSLRPEAIAYLAESSLITVFMVYLLSFRSKSADGWLMVGMSVIHTINFLMGFGYHATLGSLVGKIHVASIYLVSVYHLWFAYSYRSNPFRRERIVAAGLCMLLVGTVYSLFLLGIRVPFTLTCLSINIWVSSVHWRKRYWGIKHGLDRRELEAFGAFAALSVVPILMFTVLWLGYSGFMSEGERNFCLHFLILTWTTWLFINFFNYATESTTFLVKLVGLFQCLTMLLLGQSGFLLVNAGVSGGVLQALFAKLILIILVSTVVIVGLFPIFFRRNLLRPLRFILDGVQRVNAGELNTQVPVMVHDEVGFLAHHFNQMTRSLRQSKEELIQYAETLETKVAERTQELKQSLDTLKATQAQLIQKEKMASLGELTAGIAHEIQNPLNFVNNFAEVSVEMADELQESVERGDTATVSDLSSELRENMTYIVENGKRAASIVRSMLEHSRSSTGERRLTN